MTMRWIAVEAGRFRPVAALWVAVLLGVAAPDPARADCTALQSAAVAAQKSGDIDRLRALFDDIAVTPGCDDRFRSQLGVAVARAIERRVYQAAEAGESLAPFESEMAQSLSYARLWRILAWLGDLERERKDYTTAAGHYQAALAVIEDEEATPQAPPTAVIEAIFKRAEQARLLAADFVPAPRTRAGKGSGLSAKKIRDYVPHSVSMPIEFVTNSTHVTPRGMKAAQELLEMLRSDPPSTVALIGHTDPRGSPDHNMRLSQERARAVGLFLRERGYQGEITIAGRGEREPLVVDNASSLTTAELYQLQRRVEVQR